jgi:hypothetical protein
MNFFHICFLLLTSAHQNHQKNIKNINLMFFQAKKTFEKHLKAEAEVLPNTPKSPNTNTLKW